MRAAMATLTPSQGHRFRLAPRVLRAGGWRHRDGAAGRRPPYATAVTRALPRARRLYTTLTVTAHDAAGNRARQTLRVPIRR
jgi:hypothetical protein